MKWCTEIRLDDMLPNGMVTGVTLRGISQVSDDHEFGLRQAKAPARSPITRKLIGIYTPVLHIEGQRDDLLQPRQEIQTP
jgi:hypothetical protein